MPINHLLALPIRLNYSSSISPSLIPPYIHIHPISADGWEGQNSLTMCCIKPPHQLKASAFELGLFNLQLIHPRILEPNECSDLCPGPSFPTFWLGRRKVPGPLLKKRGCLIGSWNFVLGLLSVFFVSPGGTTPRIDYSSQRERTFCDIVYSNS